MIFFFNMLVLALSARQGWWTDGPLVTIPYMFRHSLAGTCTGSDSQKGGESNYHKSGTVAHAFFPARNLLSESRLFALNG